MMQVCKIINGGLWYVTESNKDMSLSSVALRGCPDVQTTTIVAAHLSYGI